jgi:hypothetical protein
MFNKLEKLPKSIVRLVNLEGTTLTGNPFTEPIPCASVELASTPCSAATAEHLMNERFVPAMGAIAEKDGGGACYVA